MMEGVLINLLTYHLRFWPTEWREYRLLLNQPFIIAFDRQNGRSIDTQSWQSQDYSTNQPSILNMTIARYNNWIIHYDRITSTRGSLDTHSWGVDSVLVDLCFIISMRHPPPTVLPPLFKLLLIFKHGLVEEFIAAAFPKQSSQHIRHMNMQTQSTLTCLLPTPLETCIAQALNLFIW